MRNPMTSKTAPSEVHTRRIRKMCTQCIHPALTRDSSSPTLTRAARICADAHTAATNALSEWVHTQKIREKCTHCIHPALTRDSTQTCTHIGNRPAKCVRPPTQRVRERAENSQESRVARRPCQPLPGLQGRFLQPRSKAWETIQPPQATMEQPPHGCDTTIPAPRKTRKPNAPAKPPDTRFGHE